MGLPGVAGAASGVTGQVNSLTSALGLPSLFPNSTPVATQPQPSVPVNTTPPPALSRKIQSFSTDQQSKNWNADPSTLPYFLKICQVDTSGTVVNNPVDVPGAILSAMGLNLPTFLFFIPPSAISIQNIFAVNVAATNQGILEENNGVVFRNIQISGTTGLLPAKTNRMKTTQPGLLAAAQSLFPATTSAVQSLVSQAKNIAKAVVGGNDGDLTDINSQLDFTRTGWFQFWQLNNFLIAYAEYKKNPKAAGLRLVFASSKDNIGYVVSPVSFTMKRDITNPLLFRYDIALKAWDITVNMGVPQLPPADIPSPDSQSIIKAVTGVLTDARQIIQGASNVLQGISSDLISIVNVYNQGVLLLQDAGGLISNVATFFPTFLAQAQSLLLNSSRNQQALLNAVNDPSVRTGNSPAVPAAVAVQIPAGNNPSAATSATLSSLGINAAAPSATTTPTGQQISDPQKQSISPQANTLATTALKTSVFQALTIDQLDIPASIQSGIDATRAASQALTAGNIYALCNNLQQISDNYAISLGSMDPVYAATYSVPMNTAAAHRTPTEDDIINEVALQDSKTAFLSTLATGQFFSERDPDPFLDANQYIQAQDQLATPSSTIAIPFQRGATIDSLAQQYLGDAKRSREIEVLNYLRAPYIDEVGFTQPILGPNGRTFVVTSITNLVINQQVKISSTSAVASQRTILNIQNIGNSEWRVTVDGLPNLSIYTPSSSPQVFAYLPGTVGPGNTILIPSDAIPDQFAAIRPTPLYDTLANSEKVFKVDIALDAQFAKDLSVSPNGDVGLVYGYNNAAQALRLAVEVEQGELDRHPSYGLATPVGTRNSDLTTPQIESSIQNTILNDPRFTNADVIISVDGDVVYVNVNAQGASGTGQVPVTFEIGSETNA